jgi:glycosyltransferase involved in cell wall biosynthesis
MKTFIIIPAYNEQKYLEKVLDKTTAYSKNIIVIDDGSTDDTQKIAKKHTKHALRHDLNLGKGAAMKTGSEYAFKHLGADAVVFIDSDDQHDPKHLPEFMEKLEEGNDLVFGVRTFSKNMPKVKIYANKFASVLIQLLFGAYIPDIPSGYKAITKKAYKQIKWNASDYGVELEIAARTAKQKLPFATITIDTIYHDHDRGMTALDALKITAKLVEWRLSI